MLALKTLLFSAALAAAEVFTVDVGESGLKFDPQTLSPKKGDTVIFHLYATHNVISGPFSSPCTPSDGGFYSGPYDQTDNGKKKFVVNVTSTDPVYYYCSVQKHCQSGMVGGWNVPSSGDTIDSYASAAKNVDSAKTPNALSGGQLEDDAQISSLTAGGSATPTASGSGSASVTGSAASTTAAASGSGSASSTGSASGSAASASHTGAAGVVAAGQANGVLAMALGFAAWFL